MTHPSYLGFQLDWPVFCKVPFFADGKDWSRGELFNWRERNIPEDRVAVLYNVQNIYHNKDLEKESKAGDRLVEMSIDQLDTLVNLLNNLANLLVNQLFLSRAKIVIEDNSVKMV